MRNEITMTDEQIGAAFDALGAGATIDDVRFTRDSVDAFRSARAQWSQPGTIQRDRDGALVIARAQVRSGTPRGTVYVVDFGSVRGVVVL